MSFNKCAKSTATIPQLEKQQTTYDSLARQIV